MSGSGSRNLYPLAKTKLSCLIHVQHWGLCFPSVVKSQESLVTLTLFQIPAWETCFALSPDFLSSCCSQHCSGCFSLHSPTNFPNLPESRFKRLSHFAPVQLGPDHIVSREITKAFGKHKGVKIHREEQPLHWLSKAAVSLASYKPPCLGTARLNCWETSSRWLYPELLPHLNLAQADQVSSLLKEIRIFL